MTLARPTATVTVDGRSFTGPESGLVRLTIQLTARGDHDSAEVLVWRSSKLADATPGATLVIAVGDEDVFTGEVSEVLAGSDALAVRAIAATVALSRTRVSQSYLDQTVEDIVRDLASAVDLDEVQGDTSLSCYGVDDRRPVWGHLRDLASLVGAELGCSASGALRFVAPREGSADVTLHYGADLIDWRAGAAATPRVPTVAAYGAASEDGSDHWHWILREPSPNGDGDGPLEVVPALRTRDAAQARAQALAARAARAARTGELAVVGRPDLRPGDLVALADLPSGDPGTLRLLTVTHLLDADAGYVTLATVEGAGAGDAA